MAEKFDEFLTLIEELQLEEYLPSLVENGFDDWEALQGITEEMIVQCGISDDSVKIQQIIACVRAAECYELKKGGSGANNKQVETVGRRPNEIEVADIFKSTAKKREKGVTDARFLAGLFVLSLQDKQYKFIGKDLRACQNVTTLHLFSNRIELLDNLDRCTKLTVLQLDSNLISKIEGLQTLKNLEKLYMNKNCISRVEGLEGLHSLREMQLNNQQIKDRSMTFDESSMAAIGDTLSVLEVINNHISDINELVHLTQLQKLRIADNNLMKFDNFLEPLSKMQHLAELIVKGNPIATMPKYRDRFVLMSKSMELLDDKKILPTEREYLLNLWRKKHGMTAGGEKKDENNMETTTGLSKNNLTASVQGKTITPIYTNDIFYKTPTNYQRLNVANDMRGNQSVQSTKHVPNNVKNQFF